MKTFLVDLSRLKDVKLDNEGKWKEEKEKVKEVKISHS